MDFPNGIIDNMATSLTGVENCCFLPLEGLIPFKIWYSDSYNTSLQRYCGEAMEKSVNFYIMIPKTPLYKGIVV